MEGRERSELEHEEMREWMGEGESGERRTDEEGGEEIRNG